MEGGKSLSTARLMLPDDANPAGNVHGGTILKMIEEAGFIVACRLCNKSTTAPDHAPQPIVASLARLYHMDFLLPMYVGQLAKLFATPTFTSDRSVEVMVDVWAENLMTGESTKTNHAILSYVAMDSTTGQPVERPIPQLNCTTDSERQLFAEGLERYQKRKQATDPTSPTPCSPTFPTSTPASSPLPGKPVSAAEVSLVQVMLPGDCWMDKVVGGGVIMKLMDNASGACAAKYCSSNVVTASIGDLSFAAPVRLGDIAHVHARPVFTSSKSIDIAVTVEVERIGGEGPRLSTTAGTFIFVSLDEHHRPKPLPPLILETEEHATAFEVGRKRYEERTAARKKKALQVLSQMNPGGSE